MLTLLLGTNQTAKKKHIKAAAQQRDAEIEIVSESEGLAGLGSIFEPQLFGAPKIAVLENLWKKLNDEDITKLLVLADDKSATVFVVEESLDKRKKINQEFLKNPKIIVAQLDAPIGTRSASEWIQNFAKEAGYKIDAKASMVLAQALLIDEDSTLDVGRAETELAKLNAYAAGKNITTEMVNELIEKVAGVDIFELLNAIAAKNKQSALKILDQYFATEAADEKSNAIKVSALLADQFRSLLIAADASQRNIPDAKVLEMTKWKSGRLFMMKKLCRNFSVKQLQQALRKLENLDRELKTGSMPPQVVLDLIIANF